MSPTRGGSATGTPDVANYRTRSWLLYTLALVILFHTVLAYGLPYPFLFAVFVLAATALAFAGGANALLCSVAFLLSTVLFGIALKLTGQDRAMFYRPTEMLRINDDNFFRIYRPNSNVAMLSPFGDIQASANVGIRVPKKIEFVTDSLGYRNRLDYRDQRYVVVGDSFVVGDAVTQDCIITEQLKAQGIDGYNLGHSGDELADYWLRIRAFEKLRGGNFKAIVFVFEGNDFYPFSPRVAKKHPLRPYVQFVQDNPVYRYTRWLYVRAFKSKDAPGAEVHSVAGEPMAFFTDYKAAVLNAVPLTEERQQYGKFFADLKPRLAHVYFIPDKYRVYHDFFDDRAPGGGGKLPDEQWRYLEAMAASHGIPITNLTDALRAEAKKLLPAKRYVFERDDSHWNCEGIGVAARVVASTLRDERLTR